MFIDLEGYASVETMLEESANRAAVEGKDAKLFGILFTKNAYKFTDMLTFGFIGKHDKARDAYDQGRISKSEYVSQTGKAAAQSGVILAATAVTGGGAALATRGASLTTQMLATGAATGVGMQMGEDINRGEVSSAGAYTKSALIGMGTGAVGRGAIAATDAAIESVQVIKSLVSDKAQSATRVTSEVVDGMQQTGQELVQNVKSAIQDSPLGNNRGAVVFRQGSEVADVTPITDPSRLLPAPRAGSFNPDLPGGPISSFKVGDGGMFLPAGRAHGADAPGAFLSARPIPNRAYVRGPLATIEPWNPAINVSDAFVPEGVQLQLSIANPHPSLPNSGYGSQFQILNEADRLKIIYSNTRSLPWTK